MTGPADDTLRARIGTLLGEYATGVRGAISTLADIEAALHDPALAAEPPETGTATEGGDD